MKIAYSLVLHEHVTASEVDYADVSEFQVVCPECSEPLFKSVRKEPQEIHYFAHHRATSDISKQCEQRVANYTDEKVAQANFVARNQTIEAFGSALIQHILPDTYLVRSGVRQKAIKEDCKKAFRNPDILKSVNVLISHFKHDIALQTFGEDTYRTIIAPSYPDKTPFFVNKILSYCMEFKAYLETPTARPILQKLIWIVAADMAIAMRQTADNPGMLDLATWLGYAVMEGYSRAQAYEKQMKTRIENVSTEQAASAMLSKMVINLLARLPFMQMLPKPDSLKREHFH